VSDTQARLDARDALQRAIRHTRKRFSAGTPEKYPGTPLYGLRLSEAEALAAELECVTAALRKISEGATGVTGIPDRDRLIGIKQEADRALAGGARAAQEDDELLHRDPYHRGIQPS
jgi:hypothetical protein